MYVSTWAQWRFYSGISYGILEECEDIQISDANNIYIILLWCIDAYMSPPEYNYWEYSKSSVYEFVNTIWLGIFFYHNIISC